MISSNFVIVQGQLRFPAKAGIHLGPRFRGGDECGGEGGAAWN